MKYQIAKKLYFQILKDKTKEEIAKQLKETLYSNDKILKIK